MRLRRLIGRRSGRQWSVRLAIVVIACALVSGPAPRCLAQSDLQVAGTAPSESPAVASTAVAPPATVLPEDVAAVARELNCPLCQGYTLQDCPLEVCAQMRGQIAERLAAGQTKDAIRAAFVADYGPQVLNAPPTHGFFLAAWVLPIIVLFAGIAGLGAWLWRGTGDRGRFATTPGAPLMPASPATDAVDYVARLERLAEDER